jgi:CheY-like chemotaxis protein
MIRVLCLDDHTYRFARLRERLGANGYSVLLVRDRRTAFNVFASTRIDAVIVDCQMDGIEDFVSALRSARPSVPIMMVSGYCCTGCRLSRSADACVQNGDSATNVLDSLELIIRSAKYGLCRSVPPISAA